MGGKNIVGGVVKVYDTRSRVYQDEGIMRTNVVLDDSLVREAIALTGVSTKRELLDMALRELIRAKRKKSLFDLAGQIELAEGYDYKAARELRNGSY